MEPDKELSFYNQMESRRSLDAWGQAEYNASGGYEAAVAARTKTGCLNLVNVVSCFMEASLH